jgi:hypothetical protein
LIWLLLFIALGYVQDKNKQYIKSR